MYQDIKALQLCIKQLCEKKGISINKLSTLSGITQSTIASIMQGKSKNPKLETLRKISRGLDMEYDEFIANLRSVEEDINPAPIEINELTCESGLLVAQHLRDLRKAKSKSLIDVKYATGAFIDYEKRISKEDFSILIALADYFDVSLDYLVGRSDDPTRH